MLGGAASGCCRPSEWRREMGARGVKRAVWGHTTHTHARGHARTRTRAQGHTGTHTTQVQGAWHRCPNGQHLRPLNKPPGATGNRDSRDRAPVWLTDAYPQPRGVCHTPHVAGRGEGRAGAERSRRRVLAAGQCAPGARRAGGAAGARRAAACDAVPVLGRACPGLPGALHAARPRSCVRRSAGAPRRAGNPMHGRPQGCGAGELKDWASSARRKAPRASANTCDRPNTCV
jgi:hypothetical protein